MEEDLLTLPTRRRVYEAVRTVPGGAAREVQRRAGTAWGETVYHLERLTDGGLIVREKGGHQDHYFVAELAPLDRRLLRLARSPSARRVVVTLLDVPGRTVPELAEATGLSPSRLSVHLGRLYESGALLTGRRGRLRTFELRERERMIRLLVTYREGLADAWVEGTLATWSDLFRA